MLYAAALGLWCAVTLLGNDDPVAHMICSVRDDRLHRGRRRPELWPAVDFHLQFCSACGPMTLALALHGKPYYIAMGLLNALFFLALKQITTDLHQIYVRALMAERDARRSPASSTPR